jgi:small subunit ribosomal protein S9
MIEVNGKPLEEYFPRETDRVQVLAPLKVTGRESVYDVLVKVAGGGPTGQAGALSLGIARALVKADGALESALKENQLLRRDSRMVERKKYGLHKARRARQFSKR